MCGEFAGKNSFEAIIVADCRQSRGVDVQGDRTERPTLPKETTRQFRSKMLRMASDPPLPAMSNWPPAAREE